MGRWSLLTWPPADLGDHDEAACRDCQDIEEMRAQNARRHDVAAADLLPPDPALSEYLANIPHDASRCPLCRRWSELDRRWGAGIRTPLIDLIEAGRPPWWRRLLRRIGR